MSDAPQTPATPAVPSSPSASSRFPHPKNLECGKRGFEIVADIGGDSFLEGSIGLLELPVGDEVILSDPLSDRSFRLNQTGTAIWMSLRGGKEVAACAEEISGLYNLAVEVARDIVLDYAKVLHHNRLLARREEQGEEQ